MINTHQQRYPDESPRLKQAATAHESDFAAALGYPSPVPSASELAVPAPDSDIER